MNAGSLFSGVGGMDYGLSRAGFRHVFFCEWDGWRRSVLARHWPGVPIYDDVRAVAVGEPEGRAQAVTDRISDHEGRRETGAGISGGLDLLCGGFPCQDVSVAGRRAGLAGERSGLFHEFARIIDSVQPRWVLVENVPGLLSSNGGRDFGVVLGTLADLGYGVGWRVLDSRFFGVPQRRRRVFIVAAAAVGDPSAAAGRAGEVLAVGSRCSGHSQTRGEAGQGVAGTLGGGAGERGWAQDVERMTFLPTAMNLRGREGGAMPEMDDVASLRAAEGGSSRSYVAAPLTSGGHPNSNMPGRRKEDDVNLAVTGFHMTQDPISSDELAPAMGSKSTGMGVGVGVRRLTPTECERLQGLPDGWTAYGPDSRRYSALGDAVTASVAEWIGRRMIEVEAAHIGVEAAA